MAENQRVAEETVSKTDNKAAADMTEAMKQTLQRLEGTFRGMSQQLENKIEEMGTRIDDLEKNVVELMLQAGNLQAMTENERWVNVDLQEPRGPP